MSIGQGKMLSAVLAGIIGMTAPAVAQQSMQATTEQATSNEDAILKQLESELQHFVDQQQRLPGQDAQIPLRVTKDPASGIIWVDFSPGYIPRDQLIYDEGLGTKIREVTNEVHNYLHGLMKFSTVEARFAGKTLNEIFPPDR
jgi:hypothetical protein